MALLKLRRFATIPARGPPPPTASLLLFGVTNSLNTSRIDSRLAPLSLLIWGLGICILPTGCAIAPRTFVVERPHVHQLKTDAFVIRSNFEISEDAPLVDELTTLKAEITETLSLKKQRDPVVVYLFSDEESYRRYMHATWPNLPPRRAYFVGTSRELAVYSYHSAFVEEDLRHEFTHGLLHASLNTVPLWLDEGLAEYFEVRGREVGLPHAAHVQLLQNLRADGWNPSLYRLEHVTDFEKMTQEDYAEAWGWVHYMLHSDDAARGALIDYIAKLRTRSVAPDFMPELEKASAGYYNAMPAHVSALATSPTAL